MSDTELDVSSIESLEAEPRPFEDEPEADLPADEEQVEAETGGEEEEEDDEEGTGEVGNKFGMCSVRALNLWCIQSTRAREL